MIDSSTLSLSKGRALLVRAVAKCESLRQSGTFVVVDASGAPVSVARMDGCAPAALPLVRAKAFATAANGEPSARFAERMAKFPGVFASYQAVLRDQPFPGAGGMPVIENGRIVGAIATGLGIGPFVKLPGVSPSQLMVDGKPANLEDTIISYALGTAYSAQHGDDIARWTEAYGTPPDPALKGSAMNAVPDASGQAVLARARTASDRVIAQATEKGARAAVAVVDAAGDVVTVDRMDGAPPMGSDVAAFTATAAVNFGMASGAIASHGHYSGGVLDRLMDAVPYRMLALPGGYPIRIGTVVVAAIGVYCHDLDLAHELAQDAADWVLPQFEGERQ
jgi:uncharacterized protein GlcG (DUF336 family)